MDVAQPCALLAPLHYCDRYLLMRRDGAWGMGDWGLEGHMLVSREISSWVTRGCWRATGGFVDLLGVFDLNHAAQESSPSVMCSAALVPY